MIFFFVILAIAVSPS